MLVDRVRIKITAGAGGGGCTSFRREKYVPRGGPDGGDGGDGGDIYVEADAQRSSLLDLKYHSTWVGVRGEHGRGKNQHGKQGADTVIFVPPGAVVYDHASGETLGELLEHGQRLLAAQGGKGGKGNARFATSTRRAPRFAEKGEPGEQRELVVELKLIADAGIVGLPNAGKSSLLASVSAAKPKVGDYPFTTVSPNLGVVPLSDGRTLTLADIPGLIEGAAEGKGLGHEFLRHIERTQALVFVIDLGDPDPVATRELLDKELAGYSVDLTSRPRIFALNKADIPENRARFDEVAAQFDEPFLISAATGEGTSGLMERLWTLVRDARESELSSAAAPERSYTYEPPYTIEREGGGFRIEGKAVRRAVQMTDFDNDEAVAHLQRKLQRMGVFKALKRAGADRGQPIYIGDVELEYEPD